MSRKQLGLAEQFLVNTDTNPEEHTFTEHFPYRHDMEAYMLANPMLAIGAPVHECPHRLVHNVYREDRLTGLCGYRVVEERYGKWMLSLVLYRPGHQQEAWEMISEAGADPQPPAPKMDLSKAHRHLQRRAARQIERAAALHSNPGLLDVVAALRIGKHLKRDVTLYHQQGDGELTLTPDALTGNLTDMAMRFVQGGYGTEVTR
ncbi:MAG: hypothetical protein CMK74_15115 [Pseudomonadales bacterium]|nr:hypothetical protein [Pseudomonadales bacterium]